MYLENYITAILIFSLIFGMFACDIQSEEESTSPEPEEYIQLAKEFENEFLSKYRNATANAVNNSNSPAMMKQQELQKIADKNGFDEEKIKMVRQEVLSIAKQYGVSEKDVNLDKYFFINRLNGEVFSKEFYRKMFAFIKYKKEQIVPEVKEMDRRISNLTKEYKSRISEETDPQKRQKLQEEYQDQLKEIRNSN